MYSSGGEATNILKGLPLEVRSLFTEIETGEVTPCGMWYQSRPLCIVYWCQYSDAIH